MFFYNFTHKLNLSLNRYNYLFKGQLVLEILMGLELDYFGINYNDQYLFCWDL